MRTPDFLTQRTSEHALRLVSTKRGQKCWFTVTVSVIKNGWWTQLLIYRN